MRAKNFACAALVAAAISAAGCTSAYTTSAYVPYYYDWTVGYYPYWVPAVDPFYYADPYWPLYLVKAQPGPSTTPPTQFDDLGSATSTLTALNKALAPVFGALRVLAGTTPTDAGNGVVNYAPQTLPAGTPMATFKLQSAGLGSSRRGWKLDAKPLGSGDDQYRTVAAGIMGNLIATNRGSGTMVVGFTELNGVSATSFPAIGRAVISAGTAQDQSKAVLTRLISFSPDGVTAPVTGVLAGDRTPDGVTHIRLPRTADVVAGPAGAEAIADRIAWMSQAGGGGYAIISGGDVDPGKYLLGRSCWANKNDLVFRDWRVCDAGRAPADCLADASTVVRIDAGTSPSACTGPLPTLPSTAASSDGPTETAPTQPPPLPPDMPLVLPQ
jgi:hypothetical protein